MRTISGLALGLLLSILASGSAEAQTCGGPCGADTCSASQECAYDYPPGVAPCYTTVYGPHVANAEKGDLLSHRTLGVQSRIIDSLGQSLTHVGVARSSSTFIHTTTQLFGGMTGLDSMTQNILGAGEQAGLIFFSIAGMVNPFFIITLVGDFLGLLNGTAIDYGDVHLPPSDFTNQAPGKIINGVATEYFPDPAYDAWQRADQPVHPSIDRLGPRGLKLYKPSSNNRLLAAQIADEMTIADLPYYRLSSFMNMEAGWDKKGSMCSGLVVYASRRTSKPIANVTRTTALTKVAVDQLWADLYQMARQKLGEHCFNGANHHSRLNPDPMTGQPGYCIAKPQWDMTCYPAKAATYLRDTVFNGIVQKTTCDGEVGPIGRLNLARTLADQAVQCFTHGSCGKPTQSASGFIQLATAGAGYGGATYVPPTTALAFGATTAVTPEDLLSIPSSIYSTGQGALMASPQWVAHPVLSTSTLATVDNATHKPSGAVNNSYKRTYVQNCYEKIYFCRDAGGCTNDDGTPTEYY
jgi:hypothetical protein